MKNWMQTKPPAGIQLNKNHPLAQGLVGCWIFNEGAGLRANDLSGNDNTGVLNNFEPMSSTQGWTGGIYGTSLMFNGTNTFVDCGNKPSLNITSPFSIEGYYNSTTVVGSGVIAGKQSSTSLTGTGYTLYRSGNIFRFEIYNGPANKIQTNSSITISSNTTYHVVGVYNGANSMLYVNGVLSNSAAAVGFSPDTTHDFIIGKLTYTNAFYFSGIISSVRMWNRALNSTEIQNLYAQPFAMFRAIKRETI